MTNYDDIMSGNGPVATSTMLRECSVTTPRLEMHEVLMAAADHIDLIEAQLDSERLANKAIFQEYLKMSLSLHEARAKVKE
jgi:hypothetical protein